MYVFQAEAGGALLGFQEGKEKGKAPEKTAITDPPKLNKPGKPGSDDDFTQRDSTVTVNVGPAGKEIIQVTATAKDASEASGRANLKIESTLTGDYASWAAAYKQLGIDHINFYQYGVVVKDDDNVSANVGWMNAAKNFVPLAKNMPFVDSPYGGVFQQK